MRTSANSSDFEWGPGPRSIAIEISEVRIAVQKLQRCEDQHFSLSRCTFWDPESPGINFHLHSLKVSDGRRQGQRAAHVLVLLLATAFYRKLE